MAVDLSPLVDLAATIASAFIIPCAPILVYYVAKKAGFEQNQDLRNSLTTSLERSIGAAVQVGKAAGDNALSNVNIKNQAVAAMTSYVVANAPDAIAHFGVSPAELAQKASLELEKFLHVNPTLDATVPTSAPDATQTVVLPSITNMGTIAAPVTLAPLSTITNPGTLTLPSAL